MTILTPAQMKLAEAKWYWRAMSDLTRDMREGTTPDQAIRELSGLQHNSDWPLLRERCAAAIRSTTPPVVLSDECSA